MSIVNNIWSNYSPWNLPWFRAWWKERAVFTMKTPSVCKLCSLNFQWKNLDTILFITIGISHVEFDWTWVGWPDSGRGIPGRLPNRRLQSRRARQRCQGKPPLLIIVFNPFFGRRTSARCGFSHHHRLTSRYPKQRHWLCHRKRHQKK